MSLEVQRMEVEAKARIASLREVLAKEARALLSAIFDGKLTATPVATPDGPRLHVEGRASVGRMLALEPSGACDPNPAFFSASLRGRIWNRTPHDGSVSLARQPDATGV
jgi:hypothetical protein